MSLTIADIQHLAEDVDLEAKEAGGRHGQGALPKDLWETYSGMANTHGGAVLLGVREKPRGTFQITGIIDAQKVLKELWDGVNNRQIISANLLNPDMVEVCRMENTQVIQITIPRALRRQRPVYVGMNPLTGTYRRNYEGDYRCDEETVRRMLAEQVEEARDARELEGYGLSDLNKETLGAYRNQFKATRPDHPWLALNEREFLRSIGGWAVNRQTRKAGLTLAGLLMFGQLRPILDAVPNYIVDYQERPEAKTEARWVDRLTTDGTWSGNLYDFYRLVIQRLYRDLKVPFQLEGASRSDDSPVHEALREALTNALIHADYTGRVSVLVVKRPDMFGFRNPGMMRVPLVDALRGGISDCRNRNLQKMFQMVGLGEQAGSGLPRIYRNWRRQHWQVPDLVERADPDQTILALRMVSLLPEKAIHALEERFGRRFSRLPERQRLALATVAIEKHVTHTRLKGITGAHPHDITMDLACLVREGFLESQGPARNKFYFFPGEPPEWADELDPPFRDPEPIFSHPEKRSSLKEIDGSTTIQNTGVIESSTTIAGAMPLPDARDPSAAAMNPSVTAVNPSVTAVNPSVTGGRSSASKAKLSAETERLRAIAAPAQEKKRLKPEVLESLIVQLCANHWLSPKEFADLLDRKPNNLPLWRMHQDGLLEAKFPRQQSHPAQKYRTLPDGRRRTVKEKNGDG